MDKAIFKKQLGRYFLSDACDFLRRYKILESDSFIDMSSTAKLSIEILFALECSLKSYILFDMERQ